MEKVCPCCNGLNEIQVFCKNCGGNMKDNGRVQETQLDDYTANMAVNDNSEYCRHILKCSSCHSIEIFNISKIQI